MLYLEARKSEREREKKDTCVGRGLKHSFSGRWRWERPPVLTLP